MRTRVLEEFKAKMRDEAQKELSSIVANAVSASKRIHVINMEIHRSSQWILDQLAPEILEERLNKMVDARLKERLGING